MDFEGQSFEQIGIRMFGRSIRVCCARNSPVGVRHVPVYQALVKAVKIGVKMKQRQTDSEQNQGENLSAAEKTPHYSKVPEKREWVKQRNPPQCSPVRFPAAIASSGV